MKYVQFYSNFVIFLIFFVCFWLLCYKIWFYSKMVSLNVKFEMILLQLFIVISFYVCFSVIISKIEYGDKIRFEEILDFEIYV